MSNERTQTVPAEVVTLLAWGQAIDRALRAREPSRAAAMARVVLARRPRHLASYQRLVEAACQLRRWHDGAEWGRRLLQADPGNEWAWQAVAQADEVDGARADAYSAWRRAFECAPYDPETRVGLSRTNLGEVDVLTLTPACLGQLHLRSYHWRQAAAVYGELVEANPARCDYLVGLAVALWRQGRRDDAYQTAQYLVRHHPHVLMGWAVLASLGDKNDRALARNPITTMDPDGEFVRLRLRLDTAPPAEHQRMRSATGEPATLTLAPAEAALLT